ncbi:MAG TPA: hypothetical protein PKA88_01645 [Polyangiaceae bacterium]|nr:hypothetical protein [Polyangiaceae bacterium]HMR79313.1 hypothetical protein [Polyangiaceae bacterium]
MSKQKIAQPATNGKNTEPTFTLTSEQLRCIAGGNWGSSGMTPGEEKRVPALAAIVGGIRDDIRFLSLALTEGDEVTTADTETLFLRLADRLDTVAQLMRASESSERAVAEDASNA